MIADQDQRDAALDPARSFIVQAPAGSGKTDLLIKRYLALLGRVQKPEEVLAITFTRKAAAEMRKRVLEGLPGGADIAHRLRIMTIDAFCASLTRQMPVLAEFGAQPDILEDASALYAEAAQRLLHDLPPAVRTLLAHLDNNLDHAASLLVTMLAKRDQWIRKTGAAPTRADLEAALAAECERLRARARAQLPRSGRASIAPGEAVERLAREVLARSGDWRKRPPAPAQLVGNEPLRLALAALLSMPLAAYTERQWQALTAIVELLPLAVAELKVVFAEHGAADFTEIAQGAVRALGAPEEPSDLLLALDHRIQHILVDEFQDTSNSQWELLERLTAGWERGDGRTLFLVGDPMQSIYRFREAEVGLFLRARREGVGAVKLEPLTLSTNFRSQEGLVAWFNGAFPAVLPAEEDETAGAVPYVPSSPNHPALSGEAVVWHGFHDRDAEASRAADLIRGATGKVAVLVRNRSHLDAIVPALKEAGIRYRAVEIETLGEKQVVQDLYALARALAHPADRVAWLAVLRAPWCGLTLRDLHALANPVPAEPDPPAAPPSATGEAPRSASGRATVWELLQSLERLSPDGQSRAARLHEALAPALANRMRASLRNRVEGAWLALGGPACVANATDLEDAEVFLDELERQEEAGDIADLAALEQSLQKLYALPDVGARPEAVEIMTIHKAKGLEFDTVIVPGLDRAPRVGDPPLLAWKTLPGRRLLLAPVRETGAEKDPLYEYVRGLDREADDLEAARLLYVGATRAKSRLHLLFCAALGEDGSPEPPAKRSLLAKIWFEAKRRFAGSAPKGEAVHAAGPSAEPPGAGAGLRRLPADFVLAPAPSSVRWAAPEERKRPDQVEYSWAGETARRVGTVAHRWLQRIAQDALAGWDANRIGRLRPRFEVELRQRGVPADELDRAVELIVTVLTNAIADERGRWLLGPHPVARSEHRLRTHHRSLRIDRYFQTSDGTKWVVDYKISPQEGGSLDAFLDQQRERYAAQLDEYAEAVGGSRCGLYFPLHNGWREW